MLDSAATIQRAHRDHSVGSLDRGGQAAAGVSRKPQQYLAEGFQQALIRLPSQYDQQSVVQHCSLVRVACSVISDSIGGCHVYMPIASDNVAISSH